MNRLAVMALVIYCIVLSFIPLSNLHIESPLLSEYRLLANHEYRETEVMILIHQVLFAYLSNALEHLYRPIDCIDEHAAGKTDESLPDSIALNPHLMSLVLFVFAHFVARIFTLRSSLALLQPLFCYRLQYHSPPLLSR